MDVICLRHSRMLKKLKMWLLPSRRSHKKTADQMLLTRDVNNSREWSDGRQVLPCDVRVGPDRQMWVQIV